MYNEAARLIFLLWLDSPSSLPSGDLWLSLQLSLIPLCSGEEELAGGVWHLDSSKSFCRRKKKKGRKREFHIFASSASLFF